MTAGGEHALSSSLGYLGLDIGRHCSSRHIAVLWLASADRTIASADANHMVSGPCADVCRFGQAGRLSARQVFLFFAWNARLLV
jgi:hypothetical protein